MKTGEFAVFVMLLTLGAWMIFSIPHAEHPVGAQVPTAPPSKATGWEVVEPATSGQHGHYALYRREAPGGWLYLYGRYASMTFVPTGTAR